MPANNKQESTIYRQLRSNIGDPPPARVADALGVSPRKLLFVERTGQCSLKLMRRMSRFYFHNINNCLG